MPKGLKYLLIIMTSLILILLNCSIYLFYISRSIDKDPELVRLSKNINKGFDKNNKNSDTISTKPLFTDISHNNELIVYWYIEDKDISDVKEFLVSEKSGKSQIGNFKLNKDPASEFFRTKKVSIIFVFLNSKYNRIGLLKYIYKNNKYVIDKVDYQNQEEN